MRQVSNGHTAHMEKWWLHAISVVAHAPRGVAHIKVGHLCTREVWHTLCTPSCLAQLRELVAPSCLAQLATAGCLTQLVAPSCLAQSLAPSSLAQLVAPSCLALAICFVSSRAVCTCCSRFFATLT